MLTQQTLVVTVTVRDRGPGAGVERFVAELEDFTLVRGVGVSPWEAVRQLVGAHRGLLERRWSTGGGRS